MKFWLRSPLFEENQEGEGGGDQQKQEAPPALTLEAIMAAIKGELPNLLEPIVNRQVNSLDKKWEKKFKAEPPPAKKTDEQNKQDDPFKADREAELQDRLTELERKHQEREQQAQQKELEAEIKSALSEFAWQPDKDGKSEGKEVAFDFYKGKAGRNEAGELVIGSLSLTSFIRQHAPKTFNKFFIPRDIGGSGNRSQTTSSSNISLDSIKTNMTPEQDAAVRAELVRAASQFQL